MFLSDLKVGEWAEIEDICDDCTCLKLIELGCLPGELVCIKMTAPFRDPIAIEVAGNLITLRKAEAQNIKIKAAIV